MKYISTRGRAPALDFESVVLAGLASDGGLYVPETIPHFSMPQIAAMQGLSYRELALKIMYPFMAEALTHDEAAQIINQSYDSFRHQAITPLKQLGTNEWLLELFHGPTLAFKDVALQFLGNLSDFLLTRRGEHAVVLGATSGDTGSAALAGCAGRERMQSFILFPHGRVSEVQRRQMTSMRADNIHNIALEGTFDDCQHIVKTLFADAEFRAKHHLVAVNSINWARILAQVVYYFYAALRLGAPSKVMRFCVPTGNFGDIFAGYIASKMGLPIEKLIIATNQNDILTRCLESGTYATAQDGVAATISPSMDIQISSNFERLMFDLYARDAGAIDGLMSQFKTEGTIRLSEQAHAKLRAGFAAYRADDAQTKAIIKVLWEQSGELLDPHTAVGIAAARAHEAVAASDSPMITLATAHPAKFPDAVKSASGQHPALPAHLADLFEREERFDTLANDIEAVKHFIAGRKS